MRHSSKCAVVVAIISVALLKLLKGIKQKRTVILVAIISLVLNLLGANELLLLFLSGLIAVAVEYRNDISEHFRNMVNVFVFPILFIFKNFPSVLDTNKPGLDMLGLFFLKVGSVLYGSGYVLIAFLKGDLVDSYHWITAQQLIDSVAVGQFTLGPFLSTATFIGYLISGTSGAIASTICIFLPSFIFVLLLVRIVDKLRSKKIIRVLLDGLNGGSLGLMCAVVIKLSVDLFNNWLLWIVFAVSFVLLYRFNISSVVVILSGIALGYLFF